MDNRSVTEVLIARVKTGGQYEVPAALSELKVLYRRPNLCKNPLVLGPKGWLKGCNVLVELWRTGGPSLVCDIVRRNQHRDAFIHDVGMVRQRPLLLCRADASDRQENHNRERTHDT